MKIIKTNDINYVLGLIVSIYAGYILHNNINFHIPVVLSIPMLVVIVYVSNYNITLGLILSVAMFVTVF